MKAEEQMVAADYPKQRKARRYSKDLSYEDCKIFKTEHPDLTRMEVKNHHTIYANAMKRLGCLDELYPAVSYPKLTYEDCLKFKEEHPELKRDYIHIHHTKYYKAMKKYGCLDELYPNMMGYKGGYSKNLTYEDCKKFREEHPNMTRVELNSYYGYKSAMIRLGCFDELFPLYENPLKYTDEELIAEAQKYDTKVEMFRKCHHMYARIKDRGLEDKAFAHMKVLGDRKKRMIYAYEFTDHSVYIGLTYNYDKRDIEHKTKENSAVRRHVKQTGLTPVHKPLTDYLPVKEAQRMEGEYVEHYRSLGWTILNVKPTGGVGTVTNKVEDAKILEYHRIGMTNRRISKILGVSEECVRRHLKSAGLINGRRGMSIRIEELDESGNVARSFNKAKEAAEYYGVAQSSIKNAIYRGTRLKGRHLRYNPEDYEIKRGKKYKYQGAQNN
jgi:hypothetical protein